MKRKLLIGICSILTISMLTGCSGAIHDFVNPVTEEPEPEVTTEHNYAVNGPQANEEEPAPTDDTEEENNEEVIEEPVEEKEPFSYVGTLSAPKDYENYKYGSAPLSSVYLGLKYAALKSNSYETTFAQLESASPEKFIESLDKLNIDSLNSILQSGWEISDIEDVVLDEEGQVIELSDTARDGIIGLQLLMTQIVGSEEQLQEFYAGTFVPDGSIQKTDSSNMIGFSLDDDEFEREHATEVTIDGKQYKVWTTVSSFGIDPENNTATGQITYAIYTLDGSTTPLKDTLGIDGDKKFKCNYIGDIENILTMTSSLYTDDHSDAFVVICSYSIDNPTGDEVIFQNDFELYFNDELVEF